MTHETSDLALEVRRRPHPFPGRNAQRTPSLAQRAQITEAPTGDHETVGPDALQEGDLIEVPEQELGTIWEVGERSGFMSSPKRDRYIFDVRDLATGEDGELTIDQGRTVRHYAKRPDWL
jgi:hypothetical protein